jgi:MraZ protein
VFRGRHQYTLDEKGRLVLPPAFREEIRSKGGEIFMITQKGDTLLGFTFNEWSQLEERILELSKKSDIMRRFRRSFIGNAQECTFDKQGRVLIPPTLRESAHLEKEIVLVGDLDHFEIWSKDKWNQEDQTLKNDIQSPEVRNELAQLGL